MNRLPRPLHDDATAIANLANNARLGSYPDLRAELPHLQQAYAQYVAAGGNVHAIDPVPISDVVGNHLRKHYKQPPAELRHIDTLRSDHEHRTCPMCGSSHSGTLDHILPKETYAAFSIFSCNLVPACKCNALRGTAVTGPGPNQRVLHPYFDLCLGTRLLAASFTDLGDVPSVAIQIIPEATHPEYAAIAFHVQTIVERTAIKNFLLERWFNLCRKPSLVVRALATNPASEVSLRQTLEDELDQLDDISGSKNNWHSIFLAGLLELDTLRWLYRQLQKPGRAPNEPLLPSG
ncbi:HNH endonuclease [Cupriavidus necator]|uniref:HNH endonuclease n=1 Tax=Cupriavidus necator TaxID=106590 RepID=UPI0027870C95|nr:hypothetical protein [Cupriavidus necator]MDQ0138959.1 5-methylcytosine-specific restriction endonuclease McrA [Cupriavidus necator]